MSTTTIGATGSQGYIQVLSDLYSELTMKLPGITQPLMLKALQLSARTFCEETEAWKEQLEPHNLVAEQTEYELDWDWCAEVRRVIEVRQNSEAGVDAENKGALVDPAGYEFDQPETLTFTDGFVPPESVTNGLEVKVVFVPYTNVCSLPRWFLNRFSLGIVAYAIWDLASEPGLKWSNPSIAAKYLGRYNTAINKGKIEVKRRNKNDYQSFRG